jgi:microsomal dipeptidase-like Zn-dependent dipeptidase
MPYFDFHVHPTLKCMFSKEDHKTSPWQSIDVVHFPWLLKWCTDFDSILCSQSNLQQLHFNQYHLICIALFAPERAMTTASLLLKQAASLSPLLDPDQLKIINSSSTRPIDLILQDINEVLLKPERFGIQGKKIVILKKGVRFVENDPDSLFVAFTVEGAHSLSSSFIKSSISAADIISHLNYITKELGWPVISMNLTHLEQYPLCNHAFGIQFINKGEFYPTGKDISPEGIQIIKECYQRKILIDLKHMSLGARRFLIERLRTASDFTSINQPLVCTHAGFAGISFSEIHNYLEYHDQPDPNYGYVIWGKPAFYKKDKDRISFNPSSINLYDEEIIAVLQSGGMLGLSMDKRILGYTAPDETAAYDDLVYEEEYISVKEKEYFLTSNTTSEKMNDTHCLIQDDVQKIGKVNPQVEEYHLNHFMAHLLHFFKLSIMAGYPLEKAMTQICIGSDFDGMINPIWSCPTIDSIGNFKKKLVEKFGAFARSNADEIQLPSNFNTGRFMDLLFYENGKNFLLQRLELIYQ